MKNYVKTIKKVYSETYPIEKRNSDKLVHLWGFYVTRPLSMLLMPLIIRTGIGANTATFLSLAIGILALFFGYLGVPIVSALLYNFFMVFDSIDGNLARLYGPSKKGELFDAAVGNITNYLFLPCLSLGIQYNNSVRYCFYEKNIDTIFQMAVFSSLLLTISMLIAKDVKLIYNYKIELDKGNKKKWIKIFEYIFRNSFGMAIAGPFSIFSILLNVFDLFLIYNLMISFVVLVFSLYSILRKNN